VDFDEVVLKRRSIRKFREDPVSERVLLKILEAGRWAPSAGNCQPWRFIVVTDVEVKKIAHAKAINIRQSTFPHRTFKSIERASVRLPVNSFIATRLKGNIRLGSIKFYILEQHCTIYRTSYELG